MIWRVEGLCGGIMNEKRRVEWHLEDVAGNILATGLLYDEGNVQVLWRADRGYTAEQYASARYLLGLMPEAVALYVKGKGKC